MAQQTINVGTAANDGTGDTLRAAGQKINSNFTEVYNTSSAAFNKANSANVLAQAAFNYANTIVSDIQTDPYARLTANAGFDKANSANVLAQAAFNYANNITQIDTYARLTANAGFDKANSANVLAQAAFDAANNNTGTANITFNDVTIQGVSYGLNLSPDPSFTENNQYFRFRGGDTPTHLHFDTSDNYQYDLIMGDDSKFVQLHHAGNVLIQSLNTDSFTANTWEFDIDGHLILPNESKLVIFSNKSVELTAGVDPDSYSSLASSSNGNYVWVDNNGAYIETNSNIWAFNMNGGLQFPDTTIQTTAYSNTQPTFNAFNIGNGAGINFDGGTGSLYWAGQSGVVQATDNKAGAYRSLNSANNSLFTFAANGSGTMSVSVEGSMFIGTANPPNDAGITTAYPGWLVVQNGAKFGAGIDILGDVGVGSVLKIEDGTHEKYQTISDATGVVTHDCSSGYIFYHNSPDNNWTANLINLNTSVNYATAITLVINQGANGYYANTLFVNGSPQTINWQGNTTPTVSNNRIDVQTFSILTTNSGYIVLGQLTGF